MGADKLFSLRDLLEARYRQKTPGSLRLFELSKKVLVSGGSHTIRLFRPYPFFMGAAAGPFIRDVDENTYIDYWQGHYANILGHNPGILKEGLARFDPEHGSWHTGFETESQIRLAELLLGRLGHRDWKIRFTTSGTLATMYAAMVAQASTGRRLVLKIAGGWHGSSPYLLKGVRYETGQGFDRPESAGIPEEFLKDILLTRFDDGDDLERIVNKNGEKIACFIIEPFLGVGGFLPASREYLALARRLTESFGIVLVFDEIISGFRFCPSGLQTLYGITPDLATFGKLIGGGHAVAAVAGKTKILEKGTAGNSHRLKAQFEGGTFSAHPLYMRAGYVMLKYLIEHADEIYPKLERAGDYLRKGIERVFRDEGIEVKCTGSGNDVVPASSLFAVNFPKVKTAYANPEHIWNPEISDVGLREDLLKLALLTQGVHVVHGGGAISQAHDEDVLERTIAAYGETARLFKKHIGRAD
jgi:glutamate-1-semialdehyde 2,1-aminomutase